jgi:hypothetical protein
MPDIIINGQSYDTAKLSKAAKAQLASIQAADQEITRLKVQLAITQTARNTYGKALRELLEKEM